MISPTTPKLTVTFLGCTKNPVEILYALYQVRQIRMSPIEAWNSVRHGNISRATMAKTLADHTNAIQLNLGFLPHVQFVFAIEHVSHDCLVQFYNHEANRKSIGMGYPHGFSVDGKQGIATPYGFQARSQLYQRWQYLKQEIAEFIEYCAEEGVSEADRRLFLPGGTLTRDLFSIEFHSLQQFLDQGMCEIAQWEIKELSSQIYAQLKNEFPGLTNRLGIKCWENRQMFCNESYSAFQGCKFGLGCRPHKNDLEHFWHSVSPLQIDNDSLSV